jgi:hypothetical protein
MARYANRAEFNKLVVNVLGGYVESSDLRAAVIIASLFVEIRLRTLISYGLSPKKVSRARLQKILKEDRWQFKELLNFARKLETITETQAGQLAELSRWRNQLAHNLEPWTQTLELRYARTFARLVRNAVHFMTDTAGPVD